MDASVQSTGCAAGLFISETMDGKALRSWTFGKQIANGTYNVFIQQVGGDGSTPAITVLGADDTPIWLRMRIAGSGAMNKTFFDYSLDNINWVEFYSTAPLAYVEPAYPLIVGVYATNWTGNTVNAVFDDFKIIRPLGPR
jgi:regulation of enolase protein 1 (concanavalin A-like superfamily)